MALWTSSVFVEEARSWVTAQLAPRGSRLDGEWEQPHARAWSSTIRFETTEGRVWFKVNGSGTAYEAPLGRASLRDAGDCGGARGLSGPRLAAGATRAVDGPRLNHQPRAAPRTARPLIVRGLISMNRLRTPSAQGTVPVSHAVVSR